MARPDHGRVLDLVGLLARLVLGVVLVTAGALKVNTPAEKITTSRSAMQMRLRKRISSLLCLSLRMTLWRSVKWWAWATV